MYQWVHVDVKVHTLDRLRLTAYAYTDETDTDIAGITGIFFSWVLVPDKIKMKKALTPFSV